MIDPVFLTLDHVLQFHDDVLAADGGAEGLRDRGLLDSAVHAPQASYGATWLVGDLFDMAAAYMFHIARNHAFVDGNKRTALLATLVFLGLNGFEIDRDDGRRLPGARGSRESYLGSKSRASRHCGGCSQRTTSAAPVFTM